MSDVCDGFQLSVGSSRQGRTVRPSSDYWRDEGEDEKLLDRVDDAGGRDGERCGFEEDGRVVAEVL